MRSHTHASRGTHLHRLRVFWRLWVARAVGHLRGVTHCDVVAKAAATAAAKRTVDLGESCIAEGIALFVRRVAARWRVRRARHARLEGDAAKVTALASAHLAVRVGILAGAPARTRLEVGVVARA